jgi:hypothetical protein
MNFERSLVKSFENYFRIKDIPADVRRWPQQRYYKQPCDIIIDSPIGHFGFECKSTSAKKIYWTSNFHYTADGTHQIFALDDYFTRSARNAYLVVEIKSKGAHNRCAFIPWFEFMMHVMEGHNGMWCKDIVEKYIVTTRHGGFYDMTPFFQ